MNYSRSATLCVEEFGGVTEVTQFVKLRIEICKYAARCTGQLRANFKLLIYFSASERQGENVYEWNVEHL